MAFSCAFSFFFFLHVPYLFFFHFQSKCPEHVKRLHSIMFGKKFPMISNIFFNIKLFDIRNGCSSIRMLLLDPLILLIFLFRHIFDYCTNGGSDNAGLVEIFREYLRNHLENYFQVDDFFYMN